MSLWRLSRPVRSVRMWWRVRRGVATPQERIAHAFDVPPRLVPDVGLYEAVRLSDEQADAHYRKLQSAMQETPGWRTEWEQVAERHGLPR